MLSGQKIMNSPVIMPSLTLKSIMLLLIVTMGAGCASSQSSRVASSKLHDHGMDNTSNPTSESAVRPVSFSETELKTDTSDLSSIETDAQREKSEIEVPFVDLSMVSLERAAESGFSLEELIGMALFSNPAITQAESAVAQASGVHYQVGLKPNPTVGYFGQEIGNDQSGGQHGIFASQTIVRGDILHWNSCVASHDVNRLKWEVEAQRRRVETDVRIGFYRALAAQQRLQRAEEFRINAFAAVTVAKQRLDAAEGTKPDLLQSELLVDEIDLSIRQSELEWEAAWAELAAMIGRPSLQPNDLVGDFVVDEGLDVAAMIEEAIAASPDLSAARARIDRARTNLQRQQNQVVPNIDVQLGFGIDDSSNDAFANVQLGMPVPVHNRNQGNIAAAQAEYVAATQNLKRLELRLRRDMAGVYRRYKNSAVAIKKYEDTMLPRAQEALTLVEKAQQAGRNRISASFDGSAVAL